MSILNFNKDLQDFEFNQKEINSINFRELALNQLFNKNKSFLIFKKFIEPEIAIKIKNYYLRNSSSFIQNDKEGNFRLFYYLNSPFKYPKFIVSLIEKSLVFKSMIAEYCDYYQIYCLMKDINPKDYEKVVKTQNFHSWSAIFWYKNSNSHFRHIDSFGELACFLNFTKKGVDYESGGIEVFYDSNKKKILLDDYNDYGDIIFLDQSTVYHEVKEIKTIKKQIGRMQFYFPSIPSNYMQKKLIFEGYPYRSFFTDNKLSFQEKLLINIKNLFERKNIHYTRKKYVHKEMKL